MFQVFWAMVFHIIASLNFCSSNKEWFFFWEIVQSISLLLKFFRYYFSVTPGELFISSFYQNQHDFVEVKPFEAGKDIPQQKIVFWKYTPRKSNCNTQHIHLLIFDQKWEMNLIKTQVSQDWYLCLYNIIARSCLHWHNNLETIK